MSKQTRLENFNNWPKSKLFDAEYRFDTITFDDKNCQWTKNCLWGDELGF